MPKRLLKFAVRCASEDVENRAPRAPRSLPWLYHAISIRDENRRDPINVDFARA